MVLTPKDGVWVRRLFPSLVIYTGMLYIVNTTCLWYQTLKNGVNYPWKKAVAVVQQLFKWIFII